MHKCSTVRVKKKKTVYRYLKLVFPCSKKFLRLPVSINTIIKFLKTLLIEFYSFINTKLNVNYTYYKPPILFPLHILVSIFSYIQKNSLSMNLITNKCAILA